MAISQEHGGKALTELLIGHGVEVVFGVPGGQTAALYDGIASHRDRIRHVPVRDERTAAYAADAYARLTGRVGVCDATVGPGTTKLPSGLGEAFNSSIPMLALVSELPTTTEARRYRGATSQSIDQERLLAPVTKWVGTVRHLDDLAPLTRLAFRHATTGRAGPVALVLSQDVLDGPSSPFADDPMAARFSRSPSIRSVPGEQDVAMAVDVIRTAVRPLMVLGGGARISGAGPAAAELARMAGMAVATTLSGKGCVDESRSGSVGVLGSLGTPAAAEIARAADIIVVVGCKFGSSTTLGWKLPAPGQRIVQIDIDPVELGRDVPAAAVLLADARTGLESIVTAWPPQTGGDQVRVWGETVEMAVGRWRRRRDDERSSPATPITPQRVMGELQSRLADDDVLVADASLSSGWVGSYLELAQPGPSTLFPRGLAGLGWAIPAAIGAAEAGSDRRVMAIMGDGAAAYAIGELSTVAERHLPVKMLVLNNSSLGWIRWYRRVSVGRGWEMPDSPQTDFHAVAAAYGIPSFRVEVPDEVGPALDEAFAAPGPAMVEVVTEVWETPIAAHRHALTDDTTAGYGS